MNRIQGVLTIMNNYDIIVKNDLVTLTIPIELFVDMVQWCPFSENKKELIKILKEKEIEQLKEFLEGWKL